MSIYIGPDEVSAVYIGGALASAVYVGDVKIWPTGAPPGESWDFEDDFEDDVDEDSDDDTEELYGEDEDDE